MSEGLVLASRYRLLRQLGAGGMGSVWLARDLNLETEIAVKLIDPGFVESVEAVDRFRREAQSAALLRSSHVVQILDHGVDQGRPFIAMELLQGEDLAHCLERQKVLSPADTGRILMQVGRALSLAHSRGVIHRDLKPENVFLSREGEDLVAKVLDFGIARRTNGLTESSVSKTRTGSMLGTPYYMSPEQATAQQVDYATDIWSFGVIAFQCLTGRHAFEGQTVGALFHAICILPMPVPSEVAAVPEGFDAWFARAVARDKTARFATMKEAAEELAAVCGMRKGDSGEYSGLRPALPSSDLLANTVVAGVTGRRLELTTGAPASTTLRGRLRRRPVLAAALAVLVVGLAAAVAALRIGQRGEPVRAPPRAALPGATPDPPLSVVAKPPVAPSHEDSIAPAGLPAPEPSTLTTAVKLPAPRASRAIAPASVQSASGPSAGDDAPTDSTKAPRARTKTVQPKKSNVLRDDNAAGI